MSIEVNKDRLQHMSLGELTSLWQYLHAYEGYLSPRGHDVNYENESYIVIGEIEKKLTDIFIY